MSASISRDEWLRALAQAGADMHSDDASVGASEFSEMTGLTPSSAARRLKKLVAAGLAMPTRKRVIDSNGKPRWIPAYRLLDVNPKSKRTRKPS